MIICEDVVMFDSDYLFFFFMFEELVFVFEDLVVWMFFNF